MALGTNTADLLLDCCGSRLDTAMVLPTQPTCSSTAMALDWTQRWCHQHSLPAPRPLWLSTGHSDGATNTAYLLLDHYGSRLDTAVVPPTQPTCSSTAVALDWTQRWCYQHSRPAPRLLWLSTGHSDGATNTAYLLLDHYGSRLDTAMVPPTQPTCSSTTMALDWTQRWCHQHSQPALRLLWLSTRHSDGATNTANLLFDCCGSRLDTAVVPPTQPTCSSTAVALD